MANRISQISGHLSNSYSRGLLAGEVAIITGKQDPTAAAAYYLGGSSTDIGMQVLARYEFATVYNSHLAYMNLVL